MFYSIRIGKMPDGTQIQSISRFDTMDEAKSKFHNDLFGYIGKAQNIFCFVCDERGNISSREFWEAQIEELETFDER